MHNCRLKSKLPVNSKEVSNSDKCKTNTIWTQIWKKSIFNDIEQQRTTYIIQNNHENAHQSHISHTSIITCSFLAWRCTTYDGINIKIYRFAISQYP